MTRRRVAVFASLCACGPSAEPSGAGGGVDASARDSGVPVDFADARPGARCDKMDIVFVIDNSGSMGEEQTNLGSNFPLFIGVLDGFASSSGEPLDYRVAVTTTGVSKQWTLPPPLDFIPAGEQSGEDGAFLTGDGCSMPRRWLERTDANVSQAFSCVAAVGVDGPSDEMPLEALRLSLTDRVADGTNAGFLRDDALLAVVLLTDENDCSRMDNNFPVEGEVCDETSPVQAYLSMLDGVKGDRGRWAVAVIAGLGPGRCMSSLGDADECTRLVSFADQTGQNSVKSSICGGDLAGALQQALQKFDTACESFPPIE
jgi:hypothetical protein